MSKQSDRHDVDEDAKEALDVDEDTEEASFSEALLDRAGIDLGKGGRDNLKARIKFGTEALLLLILVGGTLYWAFLFLTAG